MTNAQPADHQNPANIQQPVEDFINGVASPSSAPGAGSVAALVGALSAALTAMACGLTVGKKQYAGIQEQFSGALAEANVLKDELGRLAEADTRAYEEVSAAFRMQRICGLDDADCQHNLNQALLNASEAPLEVGRRARRILDLAIVSAEKGNINTVCDAGVAAILAESALQSARLTVETNLANVPDSPRKAAISAELHAILGDTRETSERVVAIVKRRLGMTSA